MLEFISTLSIFLLIFVEIVLTIFCIKKLHFFENKVNEIHVKMLERAQKLIEINDEIQKNLKKINKIIKIVSNKRFYQIKRLIMMIIDVVQVIMLVKSLNFAKGAKIIDYKLLKNIAYARIVQQVIRKFLDFAQNLCAI
ncbi:MAG: hypothetical protein IKU37_06790 [Candidatus Gastranaerophilales bacterium]|nr:hypothetical protein [Candidatus Gastranaerophilales bacterium]